MLFQSSRLEWLGNIRADVLAGIVVALALIPEAIAFSIIAGVDPKIGLYASFSMAVVTAITGGRPAMISAATGAMALLMGPLVKNYGLDYLFAATILAGMIQLVAGYFKLGHYMRFVSRSVVTGFVNALAILIFLAQLPELMHVTWHVYALTLAGLSIIYLFPNVTKAIPSPLICILILTMIAVIYKLPVHTVGDMGSLPSSLPTFLWPNVPFNINTLYILLPFSIPLAMVGLLESMMTATIVDDMTETNSDKNRECKAQGFANVITGFLGGMAGCAMIGQSMINVKSGGRGRLSSLTAGVVLLILVVFLSDWVSQIPMAALVAVMIMVSIATFSWDSIKNATKKPLSSNVVMLATVIMVVATHNLAYGVMTGVVLAALFFTHKVGHFNQIHTVFDPQGQCRVYEVKGQFFFATSDSFIKAFDFNESLDNIIIDVHQAHFWDITSLEALDKVVMKFKRFGKEVRVDGREDATRFMVQRSHAKPSSSTLLNSH